MSCTKVMSINTATAAADIKIKLTLMEAMNMKTLEGQLTAQGMKAVSYTHLTLPTNREV